MASGLSYRYFHSQRSNNLAIIQAHIFSVRGKVWIVIVLTENIILSMGYDDAEMFTSEVHDPYARTTGA